MITPQVSEALMFSGINPPANGSRTKCPKCSHTRKKHWEKPLKITVNDLGVFWKCFHCGEEDMAVVCE